MKNIIKHLSLFFVILTLGACASLERLAIPNKSLIRQDLKTVGKHSDINHTAWNAFLQNYTQKDNQGVVRVNYARVSQHDHKSLKNYITALSNVDSKKLSRDAQLAYWANLYNATTVNVILDHYPVDSIRDIKDGFFDLGPWEDKRLEVNGAKLSLHDIEHGIVRPLWSDTPEIHYILNCAAAGCPNLSQQAYTANNIQNQMHQAAKDYVNDPLRGVVSYKDGRIVVSKIYAWYLDDFGGSQAGILDHLRQYAALDLKENLNNVQVIHAYYYDWDLNSSNNANSLKKPSLLLPEKYN